MRRRRIRPPGVEPAVLADQRELLLGRERDAVGHRHLVEGAGDGAFEARPVVAEDVDDERVVELAHLLDRVEQAPDVRVGVLLEAGVDLHLARVERPLVVGQRVPGREEVGPRREDGILRDDAELLLALEGLLAEHVPALVELALVLLAPLGGHVVRRVRAAGRVVHEPRLDRVLGTHRVQPLHRVIGEGVRQVERFSVRALGHADDRVVLRDERVVLARLGARGSPRSGRSPSPSASGRAARRRPGRGRASGATCRSRRSRSRCRAAPAGTARRSWAPTPCSPGTGPGTRRSSRSRRSGCCARSASPPSWASTSRSRGSGCR